MIDLCSLLTDTSLGLRVLVGADGATGRAGQDEPDRPVRWVHITELPDPALYVREYELVLTNGLGFDGESSAERFVASVKRSGAAGIVFGLRRETPVMPHELVDVCARERVTLLELGISVPFTAVSRAVAALYAEQRQQELMGVVRRNNDLVQVISRGDGMVAVLGVLRRDHPGLDVTVVDRAGRDLAAVGSPLDAEKLRAVADALGRHPPPLEVALEGRGTASLFRVDTLGSPGGVETALVCLRSMHELSSGELEALEQTARFLSLEAARTRIARTVEMRFAGELLDMISSGTRAEQEIASRLTAFGIDTRSPLAVCALVCSPASQERLAELAEAITGFFITEGTPAVVAESGQDVVTIFPWQRSENALHALVTRLVNAAATETGNSRVVAGLGDISPSVGALRSSLLEARETCRVLRRRSEGPVAARLRDLDMYRLLLGRHSRETLRELAAVVLDPIRAHDRDRDSCLESTVRAFLDHDGHWAVTAEALHVHVNTLRNRLARVASLTGRDVSRTRDRVDLFLALEAADTAERGR